MKPISKWKAGIWFYSAANSIFAPIGMIAYFILDGGNLEVLASNEMMSSMLGVVIGYALCVFLAVFLWKSENKKCNYNKMHMKMFIKIGFQGYLKLLLIGIVVMFWFMSWGLGIKFSREKRMPEFITGENGDIYNVTQGVNGHYYVDYGYGKGSSPLRDCGGYYMDDNGREYYK